MIKKQQPDWRVIWEEVVLPLCGLFLCLGLLTLLLIGPILVFKRINHWAGVGAGILAVPAWVLLGPKPMPGLVPGIICVSGFLVLIGHAVVLAVLAILK